MRANTETAAEDRASARARARDDKIALESLNGTTARDPRLDALNHGEAIPDDVLACFLEPGTPNDRRTMRLATKNWALAHGFADGEVEADVFDGGALYCALPASDPRHDEVWARLEREWDRGGQPSAKTLARDLRETLHRRADAALSAEFARTSRRRGDSKKLSADASAALDEIETRRSAEHPDTVSRLLALNATVGEGGVDRARRLLTSASLDELAIEHERLDGVPTRWRTRYAAEAVSDAALRRLFTDAGVPVSRLDDTLPPAAVGRICGIVARRVDGLGHGYVDELVRLDEHDDQWLRELDAAAMEGTLGDVAVREVREGYDDARQGRAQWAPVNTLRDVLDTVLLVSARTASRCAYDPSQHMDPLFDLPVSA